ncbi:glucosaminidase domain-containing protein [Ornithinibacillus bavariensis]|uniref:Mannosyl-glycoprotein endo-beta-N-acetylglucosamidase-like domain-containing protein n=1 Tax=Ornithinibacillus bavariensis TaxID=545502 RepID=A0A919X9D7_9BACI|nr:N-acetylglucosaminidase [Ornithinibacillus bavariensis]GIO26925.1 hypothetical protein J43TS3_15360 [Ornithinibacillus bavariensis]
MNLRKTIIGLLALFLIVSQLATPLSVYADEGNFDVPDNETINLFLVTQELLLDNGIRISEGTYIYGERKSESITIQFADYSIDIPNEFVRLIEKSEDIPIYSKYLEEETSIKVLRKDTLGYSIEPFENPQLIFNLEIDYPVTVDENGYPFILLGNVKFYIEEPISEKVPEKNQELEESGNDSDESNVSEGPSQSIEKQDEKSFQTGSLPDKKESTSTTETDQEFKLSNTAQDTIADPWEGVKSDYFKVTEDNVVVYDNRVGGTLKAVGTLERNQIYPRVSDYGNWHRIQFGDIYGYVQKNSTIPDNGKSLRNENNSFKNQERTFKTLQNVIVYDNSSGSLVPFGQIYMGENYPIVSDYGMWWRIIYSDRVGYVRKSEVDIQFVNSDKYFKAEGNSIVYDNRNGTLTPVGQLISGQVYPRVSDYGNWHRIDFGNFYGYVKKSETSFATGTEIKNIKMSYDKFRDFLALETVTVYDNSSGSLLPFGKIEKGTTFPMVSDYGNWWTIVYANRVGYIKKSEVKVEVKSNDSYFRALENLPIYDNKTGSLVKVGEIKANQSYRIYSDYGNWWRVRFGESFGYIEKSKSGYATKNEINNLNTNLKNSRDKIVTSGVVTIYDNSSGTIVPFGELEANTIYPVVSDYGNWWRILFLDRVGFIRKSDVKPYGITYTNINISLTDAATKQMKAKPQTDVYLNGDLYVRWDAFKSTNGIDSGVVSSGWRIRTGPGTNYQTAYLTTKDINVRLLEEARDSQGAKWWKISRDSLPNSLGNWVDANYEEVLYNMNPNNFVNDPTQKYQFLDLRYYTGVPASELDALLAGKGTLNGTGKIFERAAQTAGINELYLVSHALLESGNGNSTLAKGVKVNNRTVYNFFGIGANDGCAVECGAQRAYKEGWFTVEAAIIGGAQFAKQNYIYSGQNTLYAMRWNPTALVTGNPTHQYATDVGWARKQVYYYERYYSSGNYNLRFDIPVYK